VARKTEFSSWLSRRMADAGVGETQLSERTRLNPRCRTIKSRKVRRFLGKDGAKSAVPKSHSECLALAEALEITADEVVEVAGADLLDRQGDVLNAYVQMRIRQEVKHQTDPLRGIDSALLTKIRRMESELAPPTVDGETFGVVRALCDLFQASTTTPTKSPDQLIAAAIRQAALVPGGARWDLGQAWGAIAEALAGAHQAGVWTGSQEGARREQKRWREWWHTNEPTREEPE
jgi:hypothetical protein